jgi:hypothetical protein
MSTESTSGKKRTYSEAEELERDEARFALKLKIPKRRLAKLMAHRASKTAPTTGAHDEGDQVSDGTHQSAELAISLDPNETVHHAKKPRVGHYKAPSIVPVGTVNHENEPRFGANKAPFIGPRRDPAIYVHKRLETSKLNLLRNMSAGRFGRTPEQRRTVALHALSELGIRGAKLHSLSKEEHPLPDYVTTGSTYIQASHFLDEAKAQHGDTMMPCDYGHRLLDRHYGMISHAGCQLCLSLSKYVAIAYNWLVLKGFDAFALEWVGPPGVLPSGRSFRADILVRLNNGDLVSVEIDDGGHFDVTATDIRRKDVCKHRWALSNGMKVVRFSTTKHMESCFPLAFPNGPDSLLAPITFVGPDTWRYYYLDGTDLYCHESIDDIIDVEDISLDGPVQPS